MKLDIGSGERPHKGFKTIDVEEYAHPDYLGDFRNMNFHDVEMIRAHHLFEHFSREEAVKVLKLWYEWLAPHGTLIIETPDFEGICKAFEKATDRQKYWLCRHAYGSQEYPWAFHRDGWWKDKYNILLRENGFRFNSFRKSCSRGYLPNITIIAEKMCNSV